MRPRIQPNGFNIFDRGVVLFGERGGEIPRDHHADVVLVRADGGDHVRVGGIEIRVEEMLHQHPDPEPDRISRGRGQPLPDRSEQFGTVLFEAFRGKLIAGCPVIDKRKETVHSGDAAAKVSLFAEKKGVKLVFVEEPMRELFEKTVEGLKEKGALVESVRFYKRYIRKMTE